MKCLCRWLTIIGAISILSISEATAEEVGNIPVPQTSVSPELKKVEPPNQKYRPGEEINYQITIRWPDQTNDLRLSPPELTLENLELLGISQETISGSETGEQDKGQEQVLTFRFAAQKPGHAVVNRFALRWIQNEGAITSELTIPPFKLTIVKPRTSWSKIAFIAAGGTAAIGILIIFTFILRRKKDLVEQKIPVQSLEERALEELRQSRAKWERTAKHSEFLSELIRLIGGYAGQKLDWNPTQDGYNALQKKAEAKWAKKEARELGELFHNLEFQRFSGIQPEREQLVALYQTIYSFIEQRKIV